MHKKYSLLFPSHCWDNYSSSKQLFQSPPSTPALQELFPVCIDSVTRRDHNTPTSGAQDAEKVSPLSCEPLQMQGHGDPGCHYAKPVRLWAGDALCKWGRYCCLNTSQKPGLALIKAEKRLLYQFPLLVFFNCDSLKINMVKHFKITFNYPSSTSIAQFSQGTVILPILLSQSLLSMSPESFPFSLPSIASPPSLLFPLEGKFPEEWGYAGLLEATCPGVQGNTATLQVQHWWILSSIHGSSDR